MRLNHFSPRWRLISSGCAVLLCAGSALGHDSWLVADRNTAAAGETVRVALVTSETFPISDSAAAPERVAEWVALAGGARRAAGTFGVEGLELATRFRLERSGVHVIGLALHARFIEIEAEDFASYLRGEGAESLLTARPDLQGRPGREHYTKFAKTFVEVAGDSAGTGYGIPVGHALEIIPLSNPCRWSSGDQVGVRVLFRGRPQPGLRVSSGREGLPEHTYLAQVRTDGDGVARFTLAEGGQWYLRTHLIRPKGREPGGPAASALPAADWESFWASITFRVAGGGPTEPPVAEKRPVTSTIHGDTRVDDYAWLRDRDDDATIAYLEAENEYTEKMMAHTEQLQEKLYQEMIGRIKQTDLTVPYRDGPYYYYSRTVEGLNYPIYCRKRGSLEAEEQVILDVNALAEGHDYYRVTRRDVSPDHRYLAYAVDTTGYEAVSICVKDLETGQTVQDVITEAAPFVLAWANDGGRTLFYGRTDETKRTNRVYRHALGSEPDRDVLVRSEDDPKFRLSVFRTRSDDYMGVASFSATTNEIWIIDATRPAQDPRVIAPRRPGVRYWGDHRKGPDGGWFYLVTDADDCPNFKLVATPVADPGPESWRVLIPHSREVFLTDVDVFARHMVISERRGGYRAMRVWRFSDGAEHLIELPEVVSAAAASGNHEYDMDTVRFSYTSLVTPRSVFDYDMNTRKRTLLKREEILGGYDPANYETHRLYALATDGVQVPISIVHRKGLVLNGQNPCLLYGYGSYGASMDPWFSSNNVSLLDRGFVYAIAHVRGGSEMGRHWKEEGRMFNKRNTFTDFIACAERLIERGYTSPDNLAIRGGSAGGLLIGAVLNMRPDLFAAAHAAVPFVDVVNTMLDAAIPLTTGEYEEWGNPAEDEYYFYIKSYSPYDNVTAQAYPHILITAGLNDPRVHYWEPAKWAAKLRATKVGDDLLLLKTNMGAGHGGASGRYGRYLERSFEYAFIIDRVGIPSAGVEGK